MVHFSIGKLDYHNVLMAVVMKAVRLDIYNTTF